MADVKQVIDDVVGQTEQVADRLISLIAVLVAVLATVMALFNIKGGNVGQAMAQAQAGSLNAWAYFQAKSTKQGLAESMLDQLLVEREGNSGLNAEARTLLETKIEFYREKVDRYEREKLEIKAKAEAYEQEYDRLNVHDDQLDVAEASINMALALLGVAALTRRRWLVWFALVFVGVGLASGIAGFVGGDFRLEFLANILG
ncbi:MAG: DUF4337 domain-containing protein [Candidatus Accumulibacter sp.]|uniref:DUF4337 domain-containing protein n=1 Tax=Accumulibacter sp. TaxID=2053492 RepID=UPI001D4324BE|nr:DUF4337 domain-containing protein [Accumulibacter sp.]MCB1944030.1 DUF4337 domain-containing protein [Accumulibacter sp.]MCP5250005.1 DUF4337 domain-containing protein [Accumulibacter sp.]